jgi:hypothetical protein
MPGIRTPQRIQITALLVMNVRTAELPVRRP